MLYAAPVLQVVALVFAGQGLLAISIGQWIDVIYASLFGVLLRATWFFSLSMLRRDITRYARSGTNVAMELY